MMDGEARGPERVSVIIPCYNCAAYLADAIDSVLSQTRRPDEIIVVDDGSTDDSVEIARGFGESVTVIEQENAGVSVARNRGIEAASGDWLALLDADDLWEPQKLERQLAAARGRPDVVCVYSDYYAFGAGRERTVESQDDHTSAPDFRAQMLCKFVNTSTALIRADALADYGFPEGVTAAEDMIFFAGLRELGPFLHVPEPLAHYRTREGSAIRRPFHEVRSIDARYDHMMQYADRYTDDERATVRRYLCDRLVAGHDRALWRERDPALARAYRRSFDRVRPPDLEPPPSFGHRLYPRWMYRLRDLLS